MKNLDRAKQLQRTLYNAAGNDWKDEDFTNDWIYKPFGTDLDFWYEKGLLPVKFCALCGEDNINEDNFITNGYSAHDVRIYLCEFCAKAAKAKGFPVEVLSTLDKKTPNMGQTDDEFLESATYLWRVTCPFLLTIFYILLFLGWFVIGWKWWGIALLINYILLGLANYFFVIQPSILVTKDKLTIEGFLHSIFLFPFIGIFVPVFTFFTILLAVITEIKRGGKK